MEPTKEYIERVKLAVEHLHGCRADYSATMPVREVFQGQVVWQGSVEVFSLTGHSKAKRAYAWSHASGKDDSDERFVAVLELPPIVSPEIAVKAVIANDFRKSQKKANKPKLQ